MDPLVAVVGVRRSRCGRKKNGFAAGSLKSRRSALREEYGFAAVSQKLTPMTRASPKGPLNDGLPDTQSPWRQAAAVTMDKDVEDETVDKMQGTFKEVMDALTNVNNLYQAMLDKQLFVLFPNGDVGVDNGDVGIVYFVDNIDAAAKTLAKTMRHANFHVLMAKQGFNHTKEMRMTVLDTKMTKNKGVMWFVGEPNGIFKEVADELEDNKDMWAEKHKTLRLFQRGLGGVLRPYLVKSG